MSRVISELTDPRHLVRRQERLVQSEMARLRREARLATAALRLSSPVSVRRTDEASPVDHV